MCRYVLKAEIEVTVVVVIFQQGYPSFPLLHEKSAYRSRGRRSHGFMIACLCEDCCMVLCEKSVMLSFRYLVVSVVSCCGLCFYPSVVVVSCS